MHIQNISNKRLFKIRILLLQGCPVTDCGIQGLCVSIVDEFGRNQEGSCGKCKSLHTLNIKNTNVTKEGVRTALENLKLLRNFNFDCSAQILAELHEEALDRDSPDIPKYSLRKFECKEFKDSDGNSMPYQDDTLELAASVCKSSVNVVHVAVLEGLTDDELLGLLNLDQLRKLSIRDETGDNIPANSITFNRGVIGLLATYKSTLTILKLRNLSIRINIRAIIEFCPNLEELVLHSNKWYSTTWNDEEEQQPTTSKRRKNEPIILPNLKILEIKRRLNSPDIPSDSFVWLLSSPLLTKLIIWHSYNLKDDIILQANNSYHFQQLKFLYLYNCSAVTNRGIDVFLKDSNALKDIHLTNCSLLTEQNFAEWEQKVVEKNWKLAYSF